jgi:hypothetical protein
VTLVAARRRGAPVAQSSPLSDAIVRKPDSQTLRPHRLLASGLENALRQAEMRMPNKTLEFLASRRTCNSSIRLSTVRARQAAEAHTPCSLGKHPERTVGHTTHSAKYAETFGSTVHSLCELEQHRMVPSSFEL